MKIKKNVQNEAQKAKKQRFAYEMTPYGSLISSLLIVSGQKWSDLKYVRLLGKARFPFVDEEDFVGKTLRAVGLSVEEFKGHTIGVYTDKYPVFAPVAPVKLKMKDGSETSKILPLPLEGDFFPNTVLNNIENVELMTI